MSVQVNISFMGSQARARLHQQKTMQLQLMLARAVPKDTLTRYFILIKFAAMCATRQLADMIKGFAVFLVAVSCATMGFGGMATSIWKTVDVNRSGAVWGELEDSTKVAVGSLSLGVPGGQVFGLLGHNDAGKTASMKMMATEFLPDPDHCTLSMSGHSVPLKRRLGCVRSTTCCSKI